ncbi:MAG TPA: hypothetical protein VMZ31_15025 [Phycisphaerae bacterium]|nr:hypothetical protein [Phycisphaerae bacterium]
MNGSETSQRDDKASTGLADLPNDELVRYGTELGLRLRQNAPRGELLRVIRQRQELLVQLGRQAMLDVCVWARRPVRQSASKEQLAREIAQTGKMDFAELSRAGLIALAKLRGVEAGDNEPDEQIRRRLRRAESLSDVLRRKRRSLEATLVGKLLPGGSADEPKEYRFLPENHAHPDLKERIAQDGLVGGIASRLRGVADDYVAQKLDEIEHRIDRKLDEIDGRLQEWRDREITNRLRIIKITLVASILVALLSGGYKYMDRLAGSGPAAEGRQGAASVATRD